MKDRAASARMADGEHVGEPHDQRRRRHSAAHGGSRTRRFAGAQRPRRLDELALAHHEHRGAHDPRRVRRRGDRQRDDDVRHRSAEHGATVMASRMAGNAISASIRRMIGLSSGRKKPGGGADERAGHAGQQSTVNRPIDQRNPRAVDDAREDIAAEMVRAEPVGRVRRPQARAEIVAQRIERREHSRRRARRSATRSTSTAPIRKERLRSSRTQASARSGSTRRQLRVSAIASAHSRRTRGSATA